MIKQKLRFYEGVDFLLKGIELSEDLNLGGDGFDAFLDVAQMRIPIIILSN
jgi:hypothetical protein